MSDKKQLSEPSAETRHADPLDYDWAHERVVKMAASAFVNARVYGLKLLKGFGYPDETFGYAQDARALQIILDRLASLHATLRETQAKIAEIAVNCPSCGRHDFGLLAGPIQRVRELEEALAARTRERNEEARKNDMQFARAEAAEATLTETEKKLQEEKIVSQEHWNYAVQAEATLRAAQEAWERDAKRYRRLQVLGCAPMLSKHLEQGTVLRFTGLDAFVDEDLRHYASRGEAALGSSPAAKPEQK